MGITGLLPFLKPASHPRNIRQYSGCTAAIDSYCWLHKGAFSCADKLAKGEPTDGYVTYCMKMVNSLKAAGIRPIMVFDGQNLPSKAGTEKKRREEKKKQKSKGINYLVEGKLKEARECFQRCTEVTSDMALDLIKACRKIGVDCIVAPYEADAQLAYLNKIGIAQIVITEDSDLVLFGCEKIFYKMDINGNGIMVEKNEISKCFGSHADSFNFDKFRYMCIMSGCDYLPSLTGIGLKKAIKFFLKANNPNLNIVLSKIPFYLKMPNVVVTNEYIQHFIQANNTFLYQLVFDPLKRRLVPLNPYENGIAVHDVPYAGRAVTNEVAFQIALGNINVDTMKKVESFDPDLDLIKPKSATWNSLSQPKAKSIWDPDYSVSETRLTIKPFVESEKSVKRNCSLFERKSDRKRPLDTEINSINGTTDEELLSMYKSETRISKIIRTETPFSGDLDNCEKINLTNSLPTLQCSSYFTSFDDKNELSSINDSSQNDSHAGSPAVDSSAKFLAGLKFDQSLSNINQVKLNSTSTPKSQPRCAPKTKCHDLFQRFGYQVNDRLTLSPLNHTPFKPVLSNNSTQGSQSQTSARSSQSQDMSQNDSVEFESAGTSQETFTSFLDSQPSDNENLSQIESLDDKYKFNASDPVLTSKEVHVDKSSLESLPFFSSKTPVINKLKKCKMPGLSRRNSTMLLSQPADAKKQLSIKESLAKYQFVKARKSFF